MKSNLKTYSLSIDKLRPFEGQPYKVLDNEEMDELVESIKANGILEPLCVRGLDNGEYEIISGHRRLHAARKAGVEYVPALIYTMSRDEAAIALVDSNLHREHILPSEKAFAYKLKMEALSNQGKRSDLTSSQIATKLDTASEVGNPAGESRDTVYRYIRLTKLIPELLDLMDEGKIAFSVGVELSYLNEDIQRGLLEIIERDDHTPSYSQAFRMHKHDRERPITLEAIEAIMSEDKPNQKETLKIQTDKLRKFAPKATDKQLEDFVLKACDHYAHYLKRQRDRDSR